MFLNVKPQTFFLKVKRKICLFYLKPFRGVIQIHNISKFTTFPCCCSPSLLFRMAGEGNVRCEDAMVRSATWHQSPTAATNQRIKKISNPLQEISSFPLAWGALAKLLSRVWVLLCSLSSRSRGQEETFGQDSANVRLLLGVFLLPIFGKAGPCR